MVNLTKFFMGKMFITYGTPLTKHGNNKKLLHDSGKIFVIPLCDVFTSEGDFHNYEGFLKDGPIRTGRAL